MRSVMKKFNRLILGLLIATMLGAGFAQAAPVVEVYFSPAVQSIERNDIVSASIMVSSNEDIQIDGVDANFFYDQNIFGEPKLDGSGIGEWMISLEDVSLPGKITYQKGSDGAAEYFEVFAGIPRQLYHVEFKVTTSLENITRNFTFQNGFINITAQGYSVNLVSNYNSEEVGILPDTTPPITEASMEGRSYNASDYPLSVALEQLSSDRSDDINLIHYTTNGIDWSTFSVSGTIVINTEGITTLNFYGEDLDGNTENVQTEVYDIDSIMPQLIGLVVTPNYAGDGEIVYVSFDVDEQQAITYPQVTIGGEPMTPSANAWPHYEYHYTVDKADVIEGLNSVRIIIQDNADNQVIDTSEEVLFDFSAPSFSNPRISAISPIEVFLEFDASEPLDVVNTEITTSGNLWTYDHNVGNTYFYRYTKTGTEGSKLIQVHGYDLGGNDAWNTTGWDLVEVRGRDLYGNWGEGSVTINIDYSP